MRKLLSSLLLLAGLFVFQPPSQAGWEAGSWAGVRLIPLDLTIRRPSIGTTSTDGLILTNPTAAAAGAQQISPRLRWTGQGWKTNATAGSQIVDWKAELVPVQGAANPQARLDFNYQINAGGYQATPTMSLLNGFVGVGTTSPGNKLSVVGNGKLQLGDSTALTLWGTNGTNNFLNSGDHLFVQSNYDLRFDIDNSNVTTTSIFMVSHDNGTELFRIQENGNVGLATTSFGTSLANGLALGAGTAPTTSPADMAQLWSADVNAEAGKNSLMMRTEITANGNGAVTGAFIKTNTGDYAAGYEGMIAINTFDNTAKIWADGAWRTIASGW